MRRLIGSVGALLILTSWPGRPVTAQRGTRNGKWRSYNGDSGSTKYAPLHQISKDNVAQLRIARRRPAVDRSLRGKRRGSHFQPPMLQSK